MMWPPPAFGESVLVAYDLRDPAQWTAAGEARRAWGHRLAAVHRLDEEHVVVEYKAGGALGVERGAA